MAMRWTVSSVVREIRVDMRRFAHKLSHVNDAGEAKMVDVSMKQMTKRRATAVGRLAFSHGGVADLITSNQLKKGDVLAVARIAGIMGAKQTSGLIPLCHPLPITSIQNDVTVDAPGNAVDVTCTVTCNGKTGVEMEALVGASIALNTVYDMCKAVDKHMVIQSLRVIEKSGGTHDFKVNQAED